jgi:uncharacterized protein HemX
MEPNQTPNIMQPENKPQIPVNNMQTSQMYNQPTEKSSVGSIVATVVIIAIIILGGLYFWGKRIETQKINESAMQNSTTYENLAETAATIEASKIETVSSGDSMSSIEADLKSTNTNNLGAEVNSL